MNCVDYMDMLYLLSMSVKHNDLKCNMRKTTKVQGENPCMSKVGES